MTTVATRTRGGLTSPFDWAAMSWFPFLSPDIRIEDYAEGDRYVVRAEIPGVDPSTDIKVKYQDGVLQLEVRREERKVEKRKDGQKEKVIHSEFRYGSFVRTIQLPAGVREDSITARYADGILEVSMNVGEPAPAGRSIPVEISTSGGKR